MYDYADMVVPLFDSLEPCYVEEVPYDDYFGQQLRGGESVPCSVQQHGDHDGQQPGRFLCKVGRRYG